VGAEGNVAEIEALASSGRGYTLAEREPKQERAGDRCEPNKRVRPAQSRTGRRRGRANATRAAETRVEGEEGRQS
jgi:hypothetical protein